MKPKTHKTHIYRGYTIYYTDIQKWMIKERQDVGDFFYLYNAKQFIDQIYYNAILKRMKDAGRFGDPIIEQS